MHTFIKINILLSILFIQGCSLFNNEPDCNNKQVIETIKSLYLNQINPNENLVVKSQPTDSINLINIKQIKNNEDGSNFETKFKEYFSNAKYLCEATIEHPVSGEHIEQIQQQLAQGTKEYQILKNNKLYIPIIYGIRQKEGSDELDIEYSAKYPTNLLQVMIILQTLQPQITNEPKGNQPSESSEVKHQ